MLDLDVVIEATGVVAVIVAETSATTTATAFDHIDRTSDDYLNDCWYSVVNYCLNIMLVSDCNGKNAFWLQFEGNENMSGMNTGTTICFLCDKIIFCIHDPRIVSSPKTRIIERNTDKLRQQPSNHHEFRFLAIGCVRWITTRQYWCYLWSHSWCYQRIWYKWKVRILQI